MTKWSGANADLWGPKKVVNKNGYEHNIHIMTMIDPATGWFEHAQLCQGESATAHRCQQILDTVWLARCPRPKEIGFDNGSEFKKEFLELRGNMDLIQRGATVGIHRVMQCWNAFIRC